MLTTHGASADTIAAVSPTRGYRGPLQGLTYLVIAYESNSGPGGWLRRATLAVLHAGEKPLSCSHTCLGLQFIASAREGPGLSSQTAQWRPLLSLRVEKPTQGSRTAWENVMMPLESHGVASSGHPVCSRTRGLAGLGAEESKGNDRGWEISSERG